MNAAVPTILQQYKVFITSPAQLARFDHAQSVDGFLQQLKCLWHLESLTDDQLLAELALCNQQLLDVSSQQLSAIWIPYRYHAKTRSMQWCLPLGHATEPFHDQYIERCRQQSVINLLINPRVSIDALLLDPMACNYSPPAGFIFHVSRCGSTWLSGCLAELDDTCVLSESLLLTEVLLDKSLTDIQKAVLLPQLIYLQSCVFTHRHNVIIKWNAWDIFQWALIRRLYPQVATIFLIRHPIEVLASHQRSTGRHMSGDPTLCHLEKVFCEFQGEQTLMESRINVLCSMMSAMSEHMAEGSALVVDYSELNVEKIFMLSEHFRLTLTAEACARVRERSLFDTKASSQHFHDDVTKKHREYTPAEQDKIRKALWGGYQTLLAGRNQMGVKKRVE